MKPFDQLTRLGKIRRLRRLAVQALESYHLSVVSLKFFTIATNTMFQVRTEDGPIDLLIGGRYFDKYERREGVWKFAERAVVADWATVTSPSAVDLEHPLIEGSHIGRPGSADPSYGFFRLLRRGEYQR